MYNQQVGPVAQPQSAALARQRLRVQMNGVQKPVRKVPTGPLQNYKDWIKNYSIRRLCGDKCYTRRHPTASNLL